MGADNVWKILDVGEDEDGNVIISATDESGFKQNFTSPAIENHNTLNVGDYLVVSIRIAPGEKINALIAS